MTGFTMSATCRLCGSDLELLADPFSDGAVSNAQVRCTKPGCGRHYVVQARILAVGNGR